MFLKDLPLTNKIKCGKWYLPEKEVEIHCARSVRKLLTVMHDSDRFVGEAGSITLISAFNRRLAFFTSHQITSKNSKFDNTEMIESLCIPSLNEDKLINLPTNALHHSTSHFEEEFADIVALEIDETFAQVSAELCYFFPITNTNIHKIHYYFYVGYPRIDGNMTLNQTGEATKICARFSIRRCFSDKNYKSEAKHFSRFTLEPSKFTADGLSGGAVFCLIETAKNCFEIVLYGIITRGNQDYLYVVDRNFLIKMAKNI